MQISVAVVNCSALLTSQVPGEHKAGFMSTAAEQKCTGETLTLINFIVHNSK